MALFFAGFPSPGAGDFCPAFNWHDRFDEMSTPIISENYSSALSYYTNKSCNLNFTVFGLGSHSSFKI